MNTALGVLAHTFVLTPYPRVEGRACDAPCTPFLFSLLSLSLFAFPPLFAFSPLSLHFSNPRPLAVTHPPQSCAPSDVDEYEYEYLNHADLPPRTSSQKAPNDLELDRDETYVPPPPLRAALPLAVVG